MNDKTLGDNATHRSTQSEDFGAATLLPCPFCGNRNVEFDGSSVECPECGTMGPCGPMSSNPAKDWNNRVPTPESTPNHNPKD